MQNIWKFKGSYWVFSSLLVPEEIQISLVRSQRYGSLKRLLAPLALSFHIKSLLGLDNNHSFITPQRVE